MQPYRKDKLEVINEDDNVIGIEERGKIHQEGLLHREVHVWFYTPGGEIIFQHRGHNVETAIDKLDATAGGHVEIGNSYIKTVIKESREETGVEINPKNLSLALMFRKKLSDKSTGLSNNILRATFTYCYKGDVNDLVPEKGKSVGFELRTVDEILDTSEEDKKNYVSTVFTDNVLNIFQEIKKSII